MKKKSNSSKDNNFKWVIKISLVTFILSVVFNIITDSLVTKLDILPGVLVLLFIIFTGIFFDIIGVAVTSSTEKPFHAMAANKVIEAKFAIKLVRNASQVSNFCNDVIGDISGIISGAIVTTIIYKISSLHTAVNTILLSVSLTSFVAALTVGGKALGKEYAMGNSEAIIYKAAKVLTFLETKLGIKLLG